MRVIFRFLPNLRRYIYIYIICTYILYIIYILYIYYIIYYIYIYIIYIYLLYIYIYYIYLYIIYIYYILYIYIHIYYIYKWSKVIHDTQSAQIPQKHDERNIYAIMKTICSPGYHHNRFVVTIYI